jgi:hypothetical protein
MGNYPYPSSYIGGSEAHPLPAWPMRAACSFLNATDPEDGELLQVSLSVMKNLLVYHA